MTTKYDRAVEELRDTGVTRMKCRGNSMLPVLPNPSTCHYKSEITGRYEVGDIVLCKVRGRWIDAHFVHQVRGDEYLVGNNHGHRNGWTRVIYGRVTRAENERGETVYRSARG